MKHPETPPLCEVVQRNCDISDARHASDYTLCVYLLKMREYYRWEKGYPFSAPMSKDEISQWLVAREQLWETLENEPFGHIQLQSRQLDPFDTEEINRMLLPSGYVYSGGFGHRAIPHFFMARLEKRIHYNDFTILISADECARDLVAPPAMTLGKTIFIRRESLRRMLWEKVQEWRWHKLDNAMARALSVYGFDEDLDAAIEQMTDAETRTVILHEIGEIMAGEQLGEAWGEMMICLPRSRGEIMARAVRDHLADSLSTLPSLLEDQNPTALHFYMANLTAMRRDLFPAFDDAYRNWTETDKLDKLKEVILQGQEHWLSLGRRMLDLYNRYGAHCIPHIETLVESNKL